MKNKNSKQINLNMNKIAFIVPYFGKFKNYFHLWLNSCQYNHEIDWLLFTDNTEINDIPKNVHVHHMTFEECKNIFQSHFDFEISMETPYKLCDFRPAYGLVFKNYIEQYDFWGHCDTDLIWGDIGKFLTNLVLNDHDHIYRYGHCHIYKNTDTINNLFKKNYSGWPTCREIFSSPQFYAFDELGFIQILEQENMKGYYKVDFFDASIARYHLLPAGSCSDNYKEFTNNILLYEEGKLYLISSSKREPVCREMLYAHFIKRNFKLENSNIDKFLIVPNKIIDNKYSTIDNTLIKNFSNYKPFHFKEAYWKIYNIIRFNRRKSNSFDYKSIGIDRCDYMSI
jgi:hypothetical protein